MIDTVRGISLPRKLWILAATAVILLGAAFLGFRASPRWLVLLLAGLGAVVLLQQPVLGLFALVALALVVPLEFGTGTEVKLNMAALLVPVVSMVWLLDRVRRRDLRMMPSNINAPLGLFVLTGLLSLLVGTVLWDPSVPRPSSFMIVQLAQWAIFAFSASALWLMGNLVCNEMWLRRITFFYLAVAGSLGILRASSLADVGVLSHLSTFADVRAPFWLLLAALAGGQLFFNQKLSTGWRLFLVGVLAAAMFYALVLERKTLSNLAGVLPAIGVLVWLRWPRLRWAMVGLAITALIFLFPDIYQFAGGDTEWEQAGGSRLALIGRVVELTMHNPITGLGPAAYRQYGKMGSLQYEGAFYSSIWLSSHNNYVDLFSHVGLLGLGLFLWFSVKVFRLGWRVRARYPEGFAAGYVNAMLAAWIGALIIMLLADWILPFVYNIGFQGFQASVLVWLFLGGLIALDNIAGPEPGVPGTSHG